MGPLIPITIFTIVGLAAGTAVAVLLIKARIKAPKWTPGWSVFPIGCAVAPIVGGLIVFVGYGLFSAFQPASAAFEDVFGRPPSPAITGLQASTDQGWDYTDIFLAFDRRNSAIDEFMRNRGFRPLSPDSAGLDTPEDALPFWWYGARWTPGHICPDGKAFVLRGQEGDDWRDVYVVDCPRRKKIYVRAVNID